MRLSQNAPNEKHRFQSQHWVQSPLPNNKIMVNMTGIVVVDLNGRPGDWYREQLELQLKMPPGIIPAGKAFQVDQWAPFVTINAIYNKGKRGPQDVSTAENHGWAVDNFSGPGRAKIVHSFTIKASLAISDARSRLYRVGYTVNLIGHLIPYNPIVG